MLSIFFNVVTKGASNYYSWVTFKKGAEYVHAHSHLEQVQDFFLLIAHLDGVQRGDKHFCSYWKKLETSRYQFKGKQNENNELVWVVKISFYRVS